MTSASESLVPEGLSVSLSPSSETAQSPAPDLPELPRLPDFLFGGWHLRRDDISRAQDKDELQGWNVSSLCSTYLNYQLDRYERQLEANSPSSAPSLASASVKTILDQLSSSSNLKEDVEYIAENFSHVTVRHILRDPRTPYVVFRVFDASPQLNIEGSSGTRKPVDIDEAVLASEQHIRSQKSKRPDYLVRLEDLKSILGPPNQYGITTFKRKTPPKGGFEFLDQKRKQIMHIWGTDAHWMRGFHHVTKRCLDGLNWENVFIAGGMVLNTLLYTNSQRNFYREFSSKSVMECDIDLYLYGLTPEEANRKVEHIYEIWYHNTHGHLPSHRPGDQIVVKTATTITFMPKFPDRRIQVILKILPSPLDILLNFDLDACALGFDGSQVLMLPRCARAIETGYSTFTMDLIWGHHLGNRRESQEVRVFKYADRGFGMRILPSYVQSLEQNSSEDTEPKTGDDRGGSTRFFNGEPGLKTLRRISYMARDFVQRRYARIPTPWISLAALDGHTMHDGLPDRMGLAVFEVVMRHCEAWRMDATGNARLDRTSFTSISYDETSQYDGLPKYDWGPCPANFSQFEKDLEDHNSQLFGILRKAIAEKLNIGPRDGRYFNYLTRRIRRLVVGPDLQSVGNKQITLPLVIPMDLELLINNELATRCGGSPNLTADHMPQLLKVHDPERHDPRTATLPSLVDTVNDSGNLRYRLITNENMWAGQVRVADEIAELLMILFNWFSQSERQPGDEPTRYGTNSYHCIWHLAKAFRRRLALPEESDKRASACGQVLSKREARLFRPWILTRPARVQRSYDERAEMQRLEDTLEKEGDIPDSAFWNDDDRGTWGSEEGVPTWV
ncbi:MAG: hypothetical protein Q9171_006968 [Xanthocarpia ochracea]